MSPSHRITFADSSSTSGETREPVGGVRRVLDARPRIARDPVSTRVGERCSPHRRALRYSPTRLSGALAAGVAWRAWHIDCFPWRMLELTARSGRVPVQPQVFTRAGVLKAGPIGVDLIGGVALIDDRIVALQPLQVRILGLLIARAGHVVTHEEFCSNVFRAHQLAESTSIARQISILRTRLGDFRHLIVTERYGYTLRLQPRGTASASD
jgi:hypothetical protein